MVNFLILFFFINGFQILILVSISKVMGKLNISLGLCTGMLYRVFKTCFLKNISILATED